MSIKAFSTQKKLDTDISGYLEPQTKDSSQFITAQKTSSDKVALDTAVSSAFRLHPTVKTVEANSTQRVIKITAHGAQKNDFLRFELSAQNPYFESGIVSVPDADTIILAAELPNTPSVGDEFYLLRYAQQRVDATGAGIVALSPAPIIYVLDGVDTEVEQDTGTPANTRPLPVGVFNVAGTLTDVATEAKQDDIITNIQSAVTELQNIQTNQDAQTTLLTTIESNQDTSNTLLNEISTNTLALINLRNNGGSLSQQALTGTTASTISVPANAVSCNIQAPSTNTDNVRISIGATASTTDGMLFEPGRSEMFDGAAAISACATVSGTNEVIVQWVLRT